jgi:methylthioribose-1-phosphate isomerase
MALAAFYSNADDPNTLIRELQAAAEILTAARPTAVNISWAVQRVIREAKSQNDRDIGGIKNAVLNTALSIAAEDVIVNMQIARIGAEVVPDRANIIHHCNTGALATVDYGTALGVIRHAHESGKQIHVYVDETRPRLQGARLTAWELGRLGIPHTVIVDGASGHIMRTHKIDLCLVGCDRIAANGDVANKIGTYNLALVARAHQVPFYSVGPTSTLDLDTQTGDDIPIEERSADEVTHVGAQQITPDDAKVANPAFDVTPAQYITAIITEKGIARPPYQESLARLFGS